MRRIVNDEALDALFRAARSPAGWVDRPVSDTLLRAVWELVKLGPTSGAGHPTRLLFIRSDDVKARLAAALSAATRAAVMSAPVIAILGRRSDCDANWQQRSDCALQAGYLILAARALGLDCGPAWDFDARAVDAAFFPDGAVAADFLCALGYGDDAQPLPQEIRPAFEEACVML
jgi:3-hydroxypropanoate dehydrogenase